MSVKINDQMEIASISNAVISLVQSTAKFLKLESRVTTGEGLQIGAVSVIGYDFIVKVTLRSSAHGLIWDMLVSDFKCAQEMPIYRFKYLDYELLIDKLYTVLDDLDADCEV